MWFTGRIRRILGSMSVARAAVVKPSLKAQRLASLLNQGLRLDPGIAHCVDKVSASMRKITDPHESARYATVADHFAGASSKTGKLALLATLVKEADARSILEIGTAYGLSGIALAMAQSSPNLVTLERGEPQATLGPANIRSCVPAGVEAIMGDKDQVIPALVDQHRSFDMVFHDGGHDGDGYVHDFDLLSPCVDRGGLYVIDDISWDKRAENRAITELRSRRTCLEGWTEVLTRDRVSGGVVYQDVGILFLD